MSRIRTRTVSGTYTDFSGKLTPMSWVSEYFSEASYPGSTACDHVLSSCVNSVIRRKTGQVATFTNNPSGLSVQGSGPGALFSAVDQLVTARLATYKWKKLPSSSDFGLLQALAELRETAQLFRLKWWKGLTHGGIEFGLKPFLADIGNLYDSFRSLVYRFKSFPYEDAITVPISGLQYTWGAVDEFVNVEGIVTVRKTGDAKLLEDYRVWLDRLGFHPDLATLWDLKPLSFIVDYFVSVGDSIESITNRGWVDSIQFTGWLTVKYELSVSWMSKSPTYFDALVGNYQVERFRRCWWADVSLSKDYEPHWPSIEAPSFRQLYNVLYVFYLSKLEKNRRRKRKRPTK